MVPNTKKSDGRQLHSLSELAEEFSIAKDAILFYEKKQLLFPGTKRTIGRAYSEFDKCRLKFILNAKNADYATGDIESLIGKVKADKPESFQIKELIEYAESKYNQLKRSLDGMDMLEQINTTCDLELLARYLRDVNTLKSRSAINDFSRLKLVKTDDDPKPAPLSKPTPPRSIQGKAIRSPEIIADSNLARYKPRGLFLAVAVVCLLMVLAFLAVFNDVGSVAWLKTLFKDRPTGNTLVQKEKKMPAEETLTAAGAPRQLKDIEGAEMSSAESDPNRAAEQNFSKRESPDSALDPMSQTVLERNRDVFAKVYGSFEAEPSSEPKTTPPKADTQMPLVSEPGSMSSTRTVDGAPSTAAPKTTATTASETPQVSAAPASDKAVATPETESDRTDSVQPEESEQSAALATFMKKITASPSQSETPETGIKSAAKSGSNNTTGDKKPAQTLAKKTAPKKPDEIKPKPETKKPVQKKPAESKKSPVLLVSPSVVPPIIAGGAEADLKTSPKMQASKTDAKQPAAPSTDNSMSLLFPDNTVQSDLPTDLIDETGADTKKMTPKKKPSPEALAWIQKSYDHVVNGEAGEAIVAATVAISFDPDVESPYINRAWAYSKKGNHDKAIQDCNKALSINPDSALALNNRGLAYQGKGEMEKAERDYEKACKLGLDVACRNYQEVTAGDNISRLLEQLEKSQVREDWDTVIRLSTQALSQSPGNVAAYNHRAMAYIQKEFFYKAIKDCNDAIKIDPDNAKSYYNRGNALTRIGNVKVATLDYKKSCDLGLDLGCQILKALK